MARPVFSWRETVDALEVLREVAFVLQADFVHDLFDIQESGFEQRLRPADSQSFQVTRRRRAGLKLEEVAEARRREVDVARQFIESPILMKIILHEGDGDLYPSVHDSFAQVYFEDSNSLATDTSGGASGV